MKINLLTSRQSCGKSPAEEEIYKRFAADYRKASPAEKRRMFLIVPQQINLETEQRVIQETGGVGLFGAEVLSFSRRFTHRLLEESGQDRIASLDEHGRVMLVQKAVSDVRKDLSVYRKSSIRPGFAIEAAAQITSFRENDITPEQLSEAGCENGSPLLQNKLNDLAEIYRAYQELLGSDREDEEGKKRMAAEAAAYSRFFKGTAIYVAGYPFLSEADLQILLGLAGDADCLTMAVTTDPSPEVDDASVFEPVNRFLDRLKREAADRGIAVSSTDIQISGPDQALVQVEEQLFSYRQKHWGKADGAVRSVVCADPWAETGKIAAEIARRVRDGEFRYRDIAVLAADVDTYAPLLERNFTEFGIPYFFDRRQPVVQSGFIEAVLSAVDTVRSGWKREEILNYAKSPFSGLTAEESDILENYVIETGINRSSWKKPFDESPFTERLNRGQLETAHQAEVIRQKLTAPFSALTAVKMSYRERSDQIRRFLDLSGAQKMLDQILEDFENKENYQDAVLYRQNWNILLEVLDQIDDALGESEASLQEYTEVLKNGLETYSIGVIPENNSAVRITDLRRGRLPGGIKMLIVPGMNEGILPSVRTPSGLLSERELQSLPDTLKVLANTRADMEEYAFYSLVTKAEDCLLFTCSQAGMTGNELKQSVYMERLADVFDPEPEQPAQTADRCLPGAVLGELSRYFSEQRGSLEKDPYMEAAAEWLRDHPDTEDGKKFRLIMDGSVFERTDDKVPSEKVRDLYGENMRVSVSRLESFASCPFSHYLDRGLKLTQREEYEVRPLDSGNLIHSFFEAFFDSLREVPGREDSDQYRKQLEALTAPDGSRLNEWIDRIFEGEQLQRFTPRYFSSSSSEYTYGKLKRMLKAAARIQARQLLQSSFRPVLLEQKLKEPVGGDNPQTASVSLEGRIDRIDIRREGEQTGVAVIDYKSGSPIDLNYSTISAGLTLQLLLYLDTACSLVSDLLQEEDGLVPLGAFYSYADPGRLNNGEISIDLKDVRLKGICDADAARDLKKEVLQIGTEKLLDPEEMTELLGFVRGKVRELTGRMLSGDTAICPAQTAETPDACRFCPYQSICGFDQNCGHFKVNQIQKTDKNEFFERLSEESQQEEKQKGKQHELD